MALSLQGWLNGLSASGIVILSCTFGLFFIYNAKKTNAKLLFYWALASICFGLTWLGDLIDFVTILLTGKNMVNPYGLHGLLCFMWLAPCMLFGFYVGAELLIPEKKWYVVGITFVLGIFFEIFLFIDPMGSTTIVYPASPGEDLINDSLNLFSLAGIIILIYILFGFIFLGFGFLYKSVQSKGVVRKKFLLLSIGQFIILCFGSLDALTTSGITRVFVRLGVLIGYWFWYLGLREEPEKKEKIKPKKEVKVEGDLFRIAQYKKEDLTEEEVSISKEKKICLVCKGRVRKFEVFLCDCDAFYCHKCARALIDIENACWVCGEPIDESRPVKPYKKVEEEIDVEISEKPQKKPKTEKDKKTNRIK